MTTQLAIRTNARLKKKALQKARQQGVTLTLVVNEFLDQYVKGDYLIRLVPTDQEDYEPDVEDMTDEFMKDPEFAATAKRLEEYLRKNPLV